VNETPEDLATLQALLDRSNEHAGAHLRSIITEQRRMNAHEVADALNGMRLLVLATVTEDGRPLAAPVDGIFFRGAFHFGSSSDSVRLGHIKKRPHVSATHLPAEELAVTVHGRAVVLDMRSGENAEFRQRLLAVYTPRYGSDWEHFLDAESIYARIDADKMFAFRAD
jgi:nitroimidazol reductase NimA-like FMN-containing flavoprotein (pyridoxamine 5'-phosphate oxidase superfamily)